ncbi:uncharacterized protein BJ212DRAFT_1587059 [Suillus subaureus]|uniref:Uncharacterized protein n=1 Tax=Suillus subaureus TaxID=48587 RepID=A0A9P7ED01_9AGAM|nr:uncharacterized protein BJ212DRAFT_1587059 [Suillus subaureus]KAG1817966.1 hypothetical protein BJ212DRAFT_1587059 [Suillus subaureus]
MPVTLLYIMDTKLCSANVCSCNINPFNPKSIQNDSATRGTVQGMGRLSDKKAGRLYPAPSPPPMVLCSQRLSGCGLESLKALQHVLIDNHTKYHTKYHIFFNHMKFNRIVKIRDLHLHRLSLSQQNFVEHLGDENTNI